MFKCRFYEKVRIMLQVPENIPVQGLSVESPKTIEWCTHQDSPCTRIQATEDDERRPRLLCGGDIKKCPFPLDKIGEMIGDHFLDSIFTGLLFLTIPNCKKPAKLIKL